MTREFFKKIHSVMWNPYIDARKPLTYAQRAEIQLKIIDEAEKPSRDVKKDDKSKVSVKNRDDVKIKPDIKDKKKVIQKSQKDENPEKPDDTDKGQEPQQKAVKPTGDSDSKFAPISISSKADVDDPNTIKIGGVSPVDVAPTLATNSVGEKRSSDRPVREGENVDEGLVKMYTDYKKKKRSERIKKLVASQKQFHQGLGGQTVKKEDEQLDEISKGTLKSYIHKADDDVQNKFSQTVRNKNKSKSPYISPREVRELKNKNKKINHKMNKRTDYMYKAMNKVHEQALIGFRRFLNKDIDYSSPYNEEMVNEVMGYKPHTPTPSHNMKMKPHYYLHNAQAAHATAKKYEAAGNTALASMHKRVRDRHLASYFTHAPIDELKKFSKIKFESVLDLNGYEFQIEWAHNDEQRRLGLMQHETLELDHGMLFDFEKDEVRDMWMHETTIPLDMLFISEEGIIEHIETNLRTECDDYINSQKPVRYVLEITAGLTTDIGICVKDRIDELSRKTLGRYIRKAVPSMADNQHKLYKSAEDNDHKGAHKAANKVLNRKIGIHVASKKMEEEVNEAKKSSSFMGAVASQIGVSTAKHLGLRNPITSYKNKAKKTIKKHPLLSYLHKKMTETKMYSNPNHKTYSQPSKERVSDKSSDGAVKQAPMSDKIEALMKKSADKFKEAKEKSKK